MTHKTIVHDVNSINTFRYYAAIGHFGFMYVENFPQTLHAGTHRILMQHTPVSNNTQKNLIYTSKHGTPAIALTFPRTISAPFYEGEARQLHNGYAERNVKRHEAYEHKYNSTTTCGYDVRITMTPSALICRCLYVCLCAFVYA